MREWNEAVSFCLYEKLELTNVVSKISAAPPHFSTRHFYKKPGLVETKSVLPSFVIKHCTYSRHTTAKVFGRTKAIIVNIELRAECIPHSRNCSHSFVSDPHAPGHGLLHPAK